jgi:hypothetical protein
VDDLTLVDVVGSMRRLLAAIDAGQLSCSAAYRNRLQGAVVALDVLASGGCDRAGQPGSYALMVARPPGRGRGPGHQKDRDRGVRLPTRDHPGPFHLQERS